jgi:hypothetical protein
MQTGCAGPCGDVVARQDAKAAVRVVGCCLSEAVRPCAPGDVLLEETYEKCVKPEGRYNGTAIKESDVVRLQRGGTGFALHDGERVQASKFWALGPGSGMADLRGQHQGGPSKGGLVFYN